ncbi:hypothetical protein YC2023_039451 [Brassica napus]
MILAKHQISSQRKGARVAIVDHLTLLKGEYEALLSCPQDLLELTVFLSHPYSACDGYNEELKLLNTPPDKSASNSPHLSSYSIITMPPQAKNLLLTSSNQFLALWQIKRQSSPSNACDGYNEELKLLNTPPNKSASNSPHLSSYSIITMPPQAKNLLLTSSNPFLALWQIKRQSSPPNKVSSGHGDSQLLFKLIYFWKARNNSKGGILLGLEMLMIDEEVEVRRLQNKWVIKAKGPITQHKFVAQQLNIHDDMDK